MSVSADTGKNMKRIKYIVQAVLGLLLSFGVMFYRGLFQAGNAGDRIMIICDGFTVTALLFISVGFLLWVSTTGFFDIFGYAVRKGAHSLIPGLVRDNLSGYYEYKLEKESERKDRGAKSTLIVGAAFLAVSLALTAVWYQCQ